MQNKISNYHATWLELFFDLSYIAAISQITHFLVTNIGFKGYIQTASLFLLLWWSWLGHTIYVNQFGIENGKSRSFESVLTFFHMFTVLAFAVFIPYGHGDYTSIFAFVYGFNRLVVVALYLKAHLIHKEMRNTTTKYLIGFGLGMCVWFASTLFLAPYVYILWIIAWAIDMITPFFINTQQDGPGFNNHHLPERTGLFTIMVLGETLLVLTGTVVSVSSFSLQSIVSLVVGFTFTVGMWWIYFDYLETYLRGRTNFTWRFTMYSHFFLFFGLISMTAGLELGIQDNQGGSPLAIRLLIFLGYFFILSSLSLYKIKSISKKKMVRELAPAGLALFCMALITHTSAHIPVTHFLAIVTFLFIGVIIVEEKRSRTKLIIASVKLTETEDLPKTS